MLKKSLFVLGGFILATVLNMVVDSTNMFFIVGSYYLLGHVSEYLYNKSTKG